MCRLFSSSSPLLQLSTSHLQHAQSCSSITYLEAQNSSATARRPRGLRASFGLRKEEFVPIPSFSHESGTGKDLTTRPRN